MNNILQRNFIMLTILHKPVHFMLMLSSSYFHRLLLCSCVPSLHVVYTKN